MLWVDRSCLLFILAKTKLFKGVYFLERNAYFSRSSFLKEPYNLLVRTLHLVQLYTCVFIYIFKVLYSFLLLYW